MIEKMPDDVKALFKELYETYAEDLLDDPKECVQTPEEMKAEITLMIKAGKYLGVDFKRMAEEWNIKVAAGINPHLGGETK